MSTINLSWKPQIDATEYNIYRSETTIDQQALPSVHASTTNAEYSDTGLAHGSVYYYVIEALDSTGERIGISKNHVVACLENAYIASETHLSKIDVLGVEVWKVTTQGVVSHVEADNIGNVYYSTENGFVVKLDSNGEELWAEKIADSVTTMLPMTNRVHVLVKSTETFTTHGQGLVVLNFSNGSITNTVEMQHEGIAITTINGESIVLCNNGRMYAYNQNGSQVRTALRSLTDTGVVELCASDNHLFITEDNNKVSKVSPVNFLDVGDAITRNVSAVSAHKDGSLYFIESGQSRNVRRLKLDGYNGWGTTKEGANSTTIDTSGNLLVGSNTEVTLFNVSGIPLWKKDGMGTVKSISCEPGRFWI